MFGKIQSMVLSNKMIEKFQNHFQLVKTITNTSKEYYDCEKQLR